MGVSLDALIKSSRERGVPVLGDAAYSYLKEEITLKKPAKILEIGTATGCSGILMLKSSEIARLTTIEIDEEMYKESGRNFSDFGVLNRVTRFLGDAGEIVPKLSGSFDFIFLDGPKGHYLEYFPYLKGLLEIGGTLFCDNVLFRGYVYKKPDFNRYSTIIRTLSGFIDGIKRDKDFNTRLLEEGDGILIAERA